MLLGCSEITNRRVDGDAIAFEGARVVALVERVAAVLLLLNTWDETQTPNQKRGGKVGYVSVLAGLRGPRRAGAAFICYKTKEEQLCIGCLESHNTGQRGCFDK